MSAVGDGAVEVAGRRVETTNTGKLFFPDDGLTKGDLVGYYVAVAEVMAPHLRDRALTLQRFPDGIDAGGFYQKDAAEHFPDWVRRVEVDRRGEGGVVNHVLGDEPATIVYLANQGAVTFHISPWRATAVDVPDVVVFDLDPPEDGALAEVRAAARAVRDGLERLGLVPFVQTTGSKGYHVVAPIEAQHTSEGVRAFARALAERVAAAAPDRFTVEQRKAKRLGRVYLDVARNGYAQTFAAPYTVRARPAAPVATPLDWDELGRAEPRSYTIENLPRRLAQKDDPWASMHASARPLADAVRRLLDEGQP